MFSYANIRMFGALSFQTPKQKSLGLATSDVELFWNASWTASIDVLQCVFCASRPTFSSYSNAVPTFAQICPVKARMITIKRIKPSPPLGQYPQPELYGQAGSAPSNSRIRIISRIVLIRFSLAHTSFPSFVSPQRKRISQCLRIC
jgi:hypothetical protein